MRQLLFSLFSGVSGTSLPLFLQLGLAAVGLLDIGVLQVALQAGLDGVDIGPAEGGLLGLLLLGEALGPALPGQGVDALDLLVCDHIKMPPYR